MVEVGVVSGRGRLGGRGSRDIVLFSFLDDLSALSQGYRFAQNIRGTAAWIHVDAACSVPHISYEFTALHFVTNCLYIYRLDSIRGRAVKAAVN